MSTQAIAETRTLRPAAVLSHVDAALVLEALLRQDVGSGGVWNATTTIWQRYDRPWNGVGGTRGDSVLVGSIGAMYDAPTRHQITLYRVTLTEAGAALGWNCEQLCDDALAYAGRTLAATPRAGLTQAPRADPFRRAAALVA